MEVNITEILSNHLSELITGTIAIVSMLTTSYVTLKNKKLDIDNSIKEQALSYRKESLTKYYNEKLNFYSNLISKIKEYEKALLDEGEEDIITDFYNNFIDIRGLPKEKIYNKHLKIILKFFNENILYLDDTLYSTFLRIEEIKKAIHMEYYDVTIVDVEQQDEYEKKLYLQTNDDFNSIIKVVREYYSQIDKKIQSDETLI